MGEKVISKEYKITDNWDGNSNWHYTVNSKDYYMRVYDIYSNKWIRSNYFTVERAYEVEKGPAY